MDQQEILDLKARGDYKINFSKENLKLNFTQK